MKNFFNEKIINQLLLNLKDSSEYKIPEDFTLSVMNRIRNDQLSFKQHMNKVYLKFTIGSAIIAVATILLALNLFTSFTPEIIEIFVIDYFWLNIS